MCSSWSMSDKFRHAKIHLCSSLGSAVSAGAGWPWPSPWPAAVTSVAEVTVSAVTSWVGVGCDTDVVVAEVVAAGCTKLSKDTEKKKDPKFSRHLLSLIRDFEAYLVRIKTCHFTLKPLPFCKHVSLMISRNLHIRLKFKSRIHIYRLLVLHGWKHHLLSLYMLV